MKKKKKTSTPKKVAPRRTKRKVSAGKTKSAPKKGRAGASASVTKKKGKRTGKSAALRPQVEAMAAAGDDPFGACFFTDNFGQNVCQQTTQSACAKITGSRFIPGGRCQ